MSLRAILWALQDAPVEDPTQALILCAMAETAHDDGTEARASQATYARYARCSERTLRRHLKAMEAAGVIIRGDQSLVAHLRPDRRPVVWDLNMPRTGGHFDRPVTGVRSIGERGDTYARSDRTRVADKPKPEPSLKNEPSTLFADPPSNATASTPPVSDRDFDEFWTAYPKKVGKPAAKTKWRAAVKRGADPQHIIRFAAEQAAIWQRHQKDPQYIPHPATWLGQARYLDEFDTPAPAAAKGHQPYRNPTDFDLYDEDF